jgi:hypothetical protein
MSWISGSCDDNDGPATLVIPEDRLGGSEEPPTVRQGTIIWVDTGSGPGFTPAAPKDERPE